jgi:hypothetical protein
MNRDKHGKKEKGYKCTKKENDTKEKINELKDGI